MGLFRTSVDSKKWLYLTECASIRIYKYSNAALAVGSGSMCRVRISQTSKPTEILGYAGEAWIDIFDNKRVKVFAAVEAGNEKGYSVSEKAHSDVQLLGVLFVWIVSFAPIAKGQEAIA
jgi:hypothetical protein